MSVEICQFVARAIKHTTWNIPRIRDVDRRRNINNAHLVENQCRINGYDHYEDVLFRPVYMLPASLSSKIHLDNSIRMLGILTKTINDEAFMAISSILIVAVFFISLVLTMVGLGGGLIFSPLQVDLDRLSHGRQSNHNRELQD